MAKIKNMGTATMRFGEGVIISGSAAEGSGYSDHSLVVSGNIKIAEGADLIFQKGESESSFIQFKNANDGTSYNAYFAYQAAEHVYISPGRGADFYLQQRTNVGGDPYTFPFRVFDDGKVKFEVGQSDGNDSATNLPSDVIFNVSGSTDNNNNAVFGGNLVTSGTLMSEENIIVNGRIGIGTDNPAHKLEVGGSISVGEYIYHRGDTDTHIRFLDNEIQVTAGNVLSYKVKSDGNVEFETAVTSSHFKVEGAGGQFVAFNEDTVKLKHVNWYSSNDRQYGQGQLWYQQWFGAVEPSDAGAQGGRRIGFFFHKPNKGASDAEGGTSAHPTNTHMYLDLNGMYLQTGSFTVNNGGLTVTGSLATTQDVDIGGNLSFEDYIMAELSIPGLDIQNDTNAFTFNCPYDLNFEQMDVYLDAAGGGDLDVDMINLDDSSNVIFDINNITNTGATPTSDTSPANQNVDRNDRIRFRIANVSGSPQGCRVNVRFRRRLS